MWQILRKVETYILEFNLYYKWYIPSFFKQIFAKYFCAV